MNIARSLLTLFALPLALSPAASPAPSVIATLRLGEDAGAVAVNATTNRIYVTSEPDQTLTVVDRNTNAILACIPLPAYPGRLAVNATTNRIYICSSEGILVVDGQTNALVTTIPIDYPSDVAVNPQTNRIYVACDGSNAIRVISGTTNIPVATLTATGGVSALAVAPQNNRIYAAADDIEVFDGATNTRVKTIAVADAPVDLAVNPTAIRLYVAHYDPPAMTIINLSNNSVLKQVALTDSPSAVDVNTTTGRVALAFYDTLKVVDGTSGATLATAPLPGGEGDIWFDTSKNTVLVARGDMTVHDGATAGLTATVPFGDDLYGCAVSAATNTVFTSGSGNGRVLAIDASTNTILPAIPLGTDPGDIAVNAKSGRIYVADYDGNCVHVLAESTRAVLGTVAVDEHPNVLAIDEQRNLIYATTRASDGTGSISVINGATNTRQTTIPGLGRGIGLAFLASNRRLFSAVPDRDVVETVDAGTGARLGETPVGAGVRLVAAVEATGRIYTTNATANEVTVLDGLARNVITSVPVQAQPMGLAYDAPSRSLLAANYGAGTVSVISADQNAVSSTLKVGTGPAFVAVNPNTRRGYVVNADDRSISVLDLGPALVLYGDADADGALTLADARKILRGATGLEKTTAAAVSAADVAPYPSTAARGFGDGRLDLRDAIRVVRKVCGKETRWP